MEKGVNEENGEHRLCVFTCQMNVQSKTCSTVDTQAECIFDFSCCIRAVLCNLALVIWNNKKKTKTYHRRPSRKSGILLRRIILKNLNECNVCVVDMCVFVCVDERGRERERESKGANV